MLSFEKLLFGLGLFLILLFQHVSTSDETLIVLNRTSPARAFFELSTTIEGMDEREEDTVDSIIIRIGCSTNIDRAFKKYQKMTNPDRFIKRIVSEIFQENPQSVEKVIQFIDKLSDVETKYFALWTLHEEMLLAKNFEFADNVLAALTAVKNSTDFETFSEFDQRNVNVLLSSLDNMEGKAKVQKKKMQELENTLLLLKEDVTNNFKAIYKLAAQIQKMEKDIMDENLEFFGKLKSQIPKIVMFLILQETVCIRQAVTNYYMYADETGHQIGHYGIIGEIFMLNNGQLPSTGYKWVFELNNDGETFNIKNSDLKEYLVANEDSLSTNNHDLKNIFLTHTKTGSNYEKWNIIPTNQGTQIKLTNKNSGKFLVSSGVFKVSNMNPVYVYDSDRDNVFTLEKC